MLFIFVSVFADLSETEKLARLCETLKYKHPREPVILLIDITASAEDFPANKVDVSN